MPSVATECVSLTSWMAAGWPFLFLLAFFSFSGGYLICALMQAANEDIR